MREFRLLIDLPFLMQGEIYLFDDETAEVYRFIRNDEPIGPLRPALANYLWLLMSEEKYMERI